MQTAPAPAPTPAPANAPVASAPAVPLATPAAPPAVVGLPAPVRPTHAQAWTAQPVHPAPPSAAGSIGGTLFALTLVIGLIFALAWLARRMPGVAGQRGNNLKVVASLALGARERLLVVDVGGAQLLLGSGTSGTRLLHRLDAPLPAAEPPAPLPFAQVLARQLGRKA